MSNNASTDLPPVMLGPSTRVLYVEDNPDDRLLLTRDLSRAMPGISVASVSSQQEFEQALGTGQFNVVITDFALGWGDGLKILHGVKTRYASCPVIMYTCSGNEEIAVTAMKGGLHDYILKNRNHIPRLADSIRAALSREEMDRQLRATRTRLSWLMNSLEVGIFSATPAGDMVNGNRYLKQLLQLPPAPAQWPRMNTLVSQPNAWEELMVALNTGRQSVSAEWRLSLANGQMRWFQIKVALAIGSGGETMVEGIMADISERKEQELAWRDKHQFISTVLNATDVLMLVADAHGRVMFANQASSAIMGLPADDLLGHDLVDLLTYGDNQAEMQTALRNLGAGVPQMVEAPLPPAEGRAKRLLVWSFLPVSLIPGADTQVIATGRDLTESRLQQDRISFQSNILAQVREAVLVCDEDNLVSYWNAGAEELYGVPRSCAIGKPWMASVHFEANSGTSLELISESLHQHGEWRGEMTQRRLDGGHLRVAATIGRRVVAGSNGVYVAIIHDLTKRYQAEEARRASEQRLRLTLHQAPAILWSTDTNLIYTTSLGAGLRGLLQEENDVTGQALIDVVKGDPQADYIVAYHRRALAGQGGHYHLRYRDCDFDVNVEPLYDPDQQIVGVIGVAVDVTELRKSQEEVRLLNEQLEAKVEARTLALRQSEHTLRLFVDHTPAAVCMLDSGHRCVQASQRWLSDFGLQRDQVIGQPLAQAMACLPAGWRKLLGTPQRHRTITAEEIYQGPNGKTEWLLWSSVPWRDGHGRHGGLMIISDYITEAKENARKLEEHQAQLQAMASGLTLAEEAERRRLAESLHDVLGPNLATAKFKLDYCRQHLQDADALKALAVADGLLETSIRHTRTLTFDLSVPVLYELGLAAALDWLAGHMQTQYGLAVKYHQTGAPFDLPVDRRVLIFQAVRELLMNVFKHARASQAWIRVKHSARRLQVTVQDNGLGITPQQWAMRPTTTHGIGLFSIRERLDQLGGSCTLENINKAGAQITLTLPLKSIRGSK
jgi:PAS domain S-box-containing protein